MEAIRSNGVSVVRDSPGGMSAKPALACATVTLPVAVDRVALTAVAAMLPSLRSVTASWLHSFGSTRPLPVGTRVPATARFTCAAPTVSVNCCSARAPQLSSACTRTV